MMLGNVLRPHKARRSLPPRFPHFAPMASIQKVAGGYRVQVDVQGRRASKTLPTKREATDWAVEKERELKERAKGHKGHGKTLRDALRKFADEESPKRRGERWEVVRLSAYEGGDHDLPLSKPLTEITDDDLRIWRDKRLKKASRGTVLRDMTLMATVLETARTEWKWLKTNPIRDVKKPRQPPHRNRVISGPEIRNMLRMLGYSKEPPRSVSQAVAVAFLVALCTGMRAGELCGLRWADMRESYGTAHNVKAIEKGLSRDVPLTSVARRLIERMRGWDDELVFGVNAKTLDVLFRRARKRAGYDDFVFHDARHTAATHIAKRLHILDLCKMFGWKRMDQALTYYNPTAAQIAARLE
jgi:integrase